MKKFLIAAILVLSCSTASAEKVYLTWRDNVADSAFEDRAWKELIKAMDHNLKLQGHESVKKMYKVIPSIDPRSSQISIQLLTRGSGSSESMYGVSYVQVRNGLVRHHGYIPASDWDADWVARKILSKLKSHL